MSKYNPDEILTYALFLKKQLNEIDENVKKISKSNSTFQIAVKDNISYQVDLHVVNLKKIFKMDTNKKEDEKNKNTKQNPPEDKKKETSNNNDEVNDFVSNENNPNYERSSESGSEKAKEKNKKDILDKNLI